MNEESRELSVRQTQVATAMAHGEMTVQEMVIQVKKIQEIMKLIMKDGEHFGVIPGTPKPTLLKPGAEKLCLAFRLDPQYDARYVTESGGHVTVVTTCNLYHIPTGQRIASGMGSCSSRETKYAYRNASLKCPSCEKEAIIKGKAEFGGGWLCWNKKGGCGAKFKDGDKSIEGQEQGKVENDNLADTYNTILKMSNKRALVAAVLNGTAASDLFTQDLDEMQGFAEKMSQPTDVTPPPAQQAAQNPAPNGQKSAQAQRSALSAAKPQGHGQSAPLKGTVSKKQYLWDAIRAFTNGDNRLSGEILGECTQTALGRQEKFYSRLSEEEAEKTQRVFETNYLQAEANVTTTQSGEEGRLL